MYLENIEIYQKDIRKLQENNQKSIGNFFNLLVITCKLQGFHVKCGASVKY